MSEILTYEYPTSSPEATELFARKLAQIAQVRDVFALYGTLGMGKSVFARAFIQKLTSAAEVPSPTFTLLQTYQAPEFEIFHYDLYRLKTPEEIFEIGLEESIYTGVNLIEWPEMMGAYLPKDIFKIEIVPANTQRVIRISAFSDNKKERLQQFWAELNG